MEVQTLRSAREKERTARAAWTAFFLSLAFPGCGHSYAGRCGLGAAWSVAFLALVLPGAVLACVVWSHHGTALLAGLVTGLAVLEVLGAAGAALRARRGGGRKPPLWVLEAHAAIVVLGVALEARWLAREWFGHARVETDALEPAARRGEGLVLVTSRYVRPVHGDIVLFRDAGDGRVRLGRAIAGDRDIIAVRGGALLVNGVPLDLTRADQRRELELARPREKLRAGLPLLMAALAGGRAEPDEREVRWDAADRGPFVLPGGDVILVPDAGEWGAAVRRGLLVHKQDILGRALR
ncbi:MAG: hypothetical protein HY721_06010 [Planctomycetes bacterium]|nr:hypothetical protein [Planctomycetota bacterium]